MSFANIQRLANTAVQSTNYFVDANVVIYAIQGDGVLAHWQKRYSDFFYDIAESTLDPKPRIVMPTMLFSEILNTWITKFAMDEYKTLNGISRNDAFSFKRDYRPTQHYKDNYEKICDDVMSIKDALLFINDSNVVTNPPLYISPVADPFDFNDYLYYQMCKEFQKSSPLTILTNDGDFQINDIPIVTLNRDLLALV